MQNDEQKKDEDLALDEEDFDLEDFDDELDSELDEPVGDAGDEDMTDESWDEFDDEHDPASDEDMAFVQADAKKKSFLQKNMVFILVVIIGAVGILYVMGSAPPATDPGTNLQDVAALEQGPGIVENTPPMPAPIQQDFEGTISAEATDLTPLPEEMPVETAALETLETLEIEETPAVPVDSTNEDLDLFGELNLEDDAEIAQADDVFSELSEETSDIENTDDQMLDDSIDFLSEEPVIETESEIIAADIEPVVESDPMPEIDISATAETSPVTEESAEETDSLNSVILELEGELEKASENFAGELAAKDRKIEELMQQVTALEGDLQNMSQENIALQKQKSANKEKTVEKPAQTPPKTEKPKSVKSPQPIENKRKWVLRGAQPGKAMVAQEGSNELQSVAVGDTLKSIGQITSIAPENGKWVVRGTIGTITQ